MLDDKQMIKNYQKSEDLPMLELLEQEKDFMSQDLSPDLFGEHLLITQVQDS